MRFIRKQLSVWRIVLIIGVAAIAIPFAARVSPTAIAVVKERKNSMDRQTTAGNEYADAEHGKDSKAAARGGARLQDDDDYYERRREYWERRVERRLDEEEGRDDQSADDNDEDSKTTKDKNSADADDEDSDDVDQEIERRREYWQKRLDRDW